MPTFALVETINPARTSPSEDGGNDLITTGIGRDIVFGGAGADVIVANAGETAANRDGNNVVFGDYGFLDYVAAHNPSPRSLDRVVTTDEAFGGNDTITTGTRNDIVLGGNGADVIVAGRGENIVFGDYGRVTGIESAVFNRPIPSAVPPAAYAPDDYPVEVLQLVEGYAPDAGEFGGADTITTGLGRDMVFGGAAGDSIIANQGEGVGAPDGNNVVFGDYGYVDYLLRDSAIPDDAHDIEVISSFATSTHLGGDDTITTGAGNDIVVGGARNDTIRAGQGANLVFGDNARLSSNPLMEDDHLTGFSVHEFLICIIETFGFGDQDGGADTIFGSDGRDILFGGAGNDVIYGFGGDDVIFGDQGKVTCTTKSYDPDDPRNGLCVDLGGTIDIRATNVDVLTGSGDDLVYAGSGQRPRHGPAGQRPDLRRGRRRHPHRRLERVRRPRRRRRHRRRPRQRPARRRQRRLLPPPRPARPAHAGAASAASSTARASPTAPTATRWSPARPRTTRPGSPSTPSRCSTTTTPSRRPGQSCGATTTSRVGPAATRSTASSATTPSRATAT